MPSSDLDLPAPSSGPAAGVAAPVARSVAEDLESIFPDEPPRAGRRLKLRLGRAHPGEAKDRRRERRLAGWGALVAAACVGVSAGALFARSGAPARPEPPAVSPGVPIAVRAPALPPPGPLNAPMTLPASPQAVTEAAAAASAAPELTRAPVAPAAAKARPRSVHASAACAARGRCGGASIYAADARLRRAYAAARRAGVDSAVLSEYRDAWDGLRERGRHEPRLVAARYRAMASDLNRLAARQRTAQADAPRTGPWRRFRMQLASMWR